MARAARTKSGKVVLRYRGPGLPQDRVTGMELSLRDQTRARIDAFRAEEASKEAARAEWVEFFRSQIENAEIT